MPFHRSVLGSELKNVGEGSDSAFHDWDYHLFLGFTQNGEWAPLKNFNGMKPSIIVLAKRAGDEPNLAVCRRMLELIDRID